MDMARKFIQMGRTRSLRYALRKGGKKYDYGNADEKPNKAGTGKVQERELDAHGHRLGGKEIPRTGEVFDQGKLDGAGVFESYLKRCWADQVYNSAWEEWRAAAKGKGKGKAAGEAGTVKAEVKEESERVKREVSPNVRNTRIAGRHAARGTGQIKKELD
jgi:hypothetical protein